MKIPTEPCRKRPFAHWTAISSIQVWCAEDEKFSLRLQICECLFVLLLYFIMLLLIVWPFSFQINISSHLVCNIWGLSGWKKNYIWIPNMKIKINQCKHYINNVATQQTTEIEFFHFDEFHKAAIHFDLFFKCRKAFQSPVSIQFFSSSFFGIQNKAPVVGTVVSFILRSETQTGFLVHRILLEWHI